MPAKSMRKIAKPEVSRRKRDRSGRGRMAPETVRRRLKPAVREQLIVDKAIEFFAHRGLEGSTLELAQHIGITQPLLYRYFPSKQALIQRAWDQAMSTEFERRLKNWSALLEDEGSAPRDRLYGFYLGYFEESLNYVRTRLYLLAGLSNVPDSGKYFKVVRRELFPRVVRVLRSAWATRARLRDPISPEELMAVNALHGSIFFLATSKWVHMPPLTFDVPTTIRLHVDLFLAGARQLYVSDPAISSSAPPRILSSA
jgi:AcrR family transcriptional regulator